MPYGKYNNPEIYNEKIIMLASELLYNVIIQDQSYERILSKIEKGDFVYLDPCYDPLKRTSFASYTPKRFSFSDREKLFGFMKSVRLKEASPMLSNNNLPIIRGDYEREGFKINFVSAARSVNCNGLGRGKIQELLITS